MYYNTILYYIYVVMYIYIYITIHIIIIIIVIIYIYIYIYIFYPRRGGRAGEVAEGRAARQASHVDSNSVNIL